MSGMGATLERYLSWSNTCNTRNIETWEIMRDFSLACQVVDRTFVATARPSSPKRVHAFRLWSHLVEEPFLWSLEGDGVLENFLLPCNVLESFILPLHDKNCPPWPWFYRPKTPKNRAFWRAPLEKRFDAFVLFSSGQRECSSCFLSMSPPNCGVCFAFSPRKALLMMWLASQVSPPNGGAFMKSEFIFSLYLPLGK